MRPRPKAGAALAVTSVLALAVLAIEGRAAASPAAAPDLVVDDVRRVPLASTIAAGGIEQHAFVLHGIPVRGAFETVRVDAAGGRRVVAGRRPTAAPQVTPDEARIAPDALGAIVADALGEAEPPRFESSPRLVYLTVLGQPVLAWEVQLALRRDPEPSRPRLWVSAMSGRLLEIREQVRTSRARVFPQNPSKTPTPIEVTLTGIDVTGPEEPLDGDRVVSTNCVDTEPASVPDWYSDGDCYPEQRVLSDQNGDFFVPIPDVVREADNIQPEDRYAELSMYYHGERFMKIMRDRGIEQFKCPLATMLANYHQLEPEDGSGLSFGPFNNAYYTDQCDPDKGPTMVFGQGSAVDFAYDGDVVYHELGHGIVALLTPDGLGKRRLREDGLAGDAGAMNEAFADYFAYSMTGDPEVGEYVGRFWPGNGRPYVRTGENDRRCPDDTIGEVHADGEPFAGALWAMRSRLGGVVDQMVLELLTRLPGDATFEDAAATLEAIAAEYHQQGRVDDFGLALVDRALRTRGMIDCPRLVADPGEVDSGRTMHLRRVLSGIQPFYPGPVQLRFEVPDGATRVVVSYRLRSSKSDVVPTARVLVKRADAPIGFQYQLAGVDDPGDATGEVGKIREVTLVSGDWDLEADGEADGQGATRTVIDGLDPGEVIHVAVVATSRADVTASSVFVAAPGFEPAGEGGSTGGGAGAGSGGVEEVRPGAAAAGGCGCRTSGGSGGALGWGLVLMLGAFRRRRWSAF